MASDAEGAGVLAEEHVGGRVVALLEDLGRHLGGVAVADVDVEPRLLLELLDQRSDQVLVAAGVDHEVGVVVAARRRARLATAEHHRNQHAGPSHHHSDQVRRA